MMMTAVEREWCWALVRDANDVSTWLFPYLVCSLMTSPVVGYLGNWKCSGLDGGDTLIAQAPASVSEMV